MLATVLEALTDLVYPAHCLLCGVHLPNRGTIHICDVCLDEVSTFNGHVCRKCGHPCGPYVPTETRCPNCRRRRLHFERAISSGRYRGPLKKLIWGLKFDCQPVYAVPLGKLMIEAAESHLCLKDVDQVVPVPLHRKRRAERGFNQSEALAQELCRDLGLSLSLDNLRRIRPTPSQTRFTRRQREQNVKGAFATARPAECEDKRLLLVDDIMTTGATTSECAKVLYGSGARSVIVLTAAR